MQNIDLVDLMDNDILVGSKGRDISFVHRDNGTISLYWRGFPSHAPKYVRVDGTWSGAIKISGNRALYNMHERVLGNIMKYLHDWFRPCCESLLIRAKEEGIVLSEGPFILSFQWHLPINYDTVRWNSKKGCVSWKPQKKGYEPRWDLSNMYFYRKVIEDTMVETGLLKDDNVSVVTAIQERFVRTDTFDSRWVGVELIPYKNLIRI